MTSRLLASSMLLASLLATSALAQHADHTDHSHHAQPGPQVSQPPMQSKHVPPDPPSHVMAPMSNEEMSEVMAMDDAERYGSLILDRLEWRERDEAFAWNAEGWYGGDYNKVLLKSEGEAGDADHQRTELVWDRAVSRWWHLQAGVRHDSGDGPDRTWAAIGVEGLAPWWIETEAAFYAGDEGRTAVRLEASQDLRLTQHLILQPQIELNIYGKDDPDRGVGSGFSDAQAALRLRYEFRREFAPFIGVHWSALFGETADIAAAAGRDDEEVQFVAGVRFWF